MDAMLLCESNMMTASTFGLDGVPREPTVTIASVGREDQEKDKKTGKVEKWGILTFREPWAKPYKVNKTARKALILMFGRETDAWIGKRITLYALAGNYFGEEGVAVRIKGSPDLTEKKSFQMKKFGGGKITYDLVPTGERPASSSSSKPTVAAPATDRAPTMPQTDASTVSAASSKPIMSDVGGKPVSSPPVIANNGPPGPGLVWAVPFGPHKVPPREVASLDDSQLLETIQFGQEKLDKEPGAQWAKSVGDQIVRLRGEVERRFAAKMEAEDAAARKPAAGAPAPREPGSDDGEPGSAPAGGDAPPW